MSRTYLTPRGLVRGQAATRMIAAGQASVLCGGGFAASAAELTQVDAPVVIASAVKATSLPPEFKSARAAFAGLEVNRPLIMGVLNVTPDSFSDGGKYASTEVAIAHGVALLDAGADILDIGGESTRPGAVPVDPAEEACRVIPVVRTLAERGAKVSIDTRNASVMAEAIAAGAAIVNDISALSDPEAVGVVANSNASIILMHMQGSPATMQKNPTYAWAPGDIFDFLKARVDICLARGIDIARISIDPGLGFGKTDTHNAQIIEHLTLFHGLGCVLTFGASRKGFIGRMSKGEGAEARLAGSLAVAVMAAERGAHILRVHDVADTRQALAVWASLSGS